MNDPRSLTVSARGDREIEMTRAFDAPCNLVYDAYNAVNASPILSINTRYGTSWRQPTEILAARTIKLGGTFSF